MKKPCKYCQNEFEAKSNAQKFCSDICKMDAALQAGGSEVKKASEVKETVKIDRKQQKVNGWQQEISLFCEKEGITPLELIEAYKDKGKKIKPVKEPKNYEETQISRISRHKQMHEPKPGTNAFYIRYGKWE